MDKNINDSSKRPLLAPTVKFGRERKSVEEKAEILDPQLTVGGSFREMWH